MITTIRLIGTAWGKLLLPAFLCAALAPAALAQVTGSVVRNGGFEDDGNPARDWSQDTGKTGDKGTILRDVSRFHSGKTSLRFQPNGRNGPPQQLAVSQEVALATFRGKSIEVSVTMRSEGEARPVAGLIVIGRGGPKLLQVNEGASHPDWVTVSRKFELADDASARYYLALWVDGSSGTAWFDDVSVAPPKISSVAAPVALATNAGPYDAWNPPLGEVVQNLTLTEGWTDARLVAAPVNTAGNGGWSDSVTVSRDGKRLYFAYTKSDYFIFESSLKFVSTGPDRTSDFSGIEMQIYQADLGPSGWLVRYHPINVPPPVFTGSPGLNSAEDLMVYNTYQITPSYRTTMRLAAKVNNAWTQRVPLPAPINSPAGCLDDNGFLVGSLAGGATLYFESTRTVLNGTTCGKTKDRHLYFATYQAGAWSDVQAVPGVNSRAAGDNDMQPFLLEDKSRIFWMANRPSQGKLGFFTADWNGRTFENQRMVIGISTFSAPWAKKVVRLGEPNIAVLPQGSVMYFMCGIALGDTAGGAPDNIQHRICFARKPN